MSEQFDENANHLDAWQRDSEKDREQFFLSDRPARHADKPDAFMECCFYAMIAAVLSLAVYVILVNA